MRAGLISALAKATVAERFLSPAVIREMADHAEYLTRLMTLTGHTEDQLTRLVQSLSLSMDELYSRALGSEKALNEIRERIEQLDAANR